MTDPINVRSKSGRVFEAQPNQVADMLQTGARPVTQEEATSATQAWDQMRHMEENWSPAERAAGGFFSGATLGLGPAALAEMGLANRNDIAAMGEDPYAFGGEVAGIIAPSLVTGGVATPAGAVSRLGFGAERLAGRLLPEAAGIMGKAARGSVTMGARGATEGSLISLAHEVSDSYIQNKPLTAQSMAVAASHGALLGGLAGGFLGGAGAVAGGAFGAVSDSMVGAAGGKGERAAAMALKRAGFTEAQLGTMAMEEGGLVGAARKFHELIEPNGASFGSSTKSIATALRDSELGFKVGHQEAVALLDREAASMVPNFERVEAAVNDALEKKYAGTLQGNPVKRALEELREDLSGLRTGRSPVPGPMSADDAAIHAYRIRIGLPEAAQVTAARELQAQMSELVPTTGSSWKQWVSSRNQLAEMAEAARGTATVDVYRTALNHMDAEIASAMDAAGTSIGNKSIGEQFRAAVMGQKASAEAGEAVVSKLGKEMSGAQPTLNQSDVGTMAWGTLMGHPVGAAGIVAGKGIARIMARKAEPWLAEKAYRLAIGGAAAKTTAEVNNHVRSTLSKFMGMGGRVTAWEASGTKEKAPRYSVKAYGEVMKESERLLSASHAAKVKDMTDALSEMGHKDLADQYMEQYMRASNYLKFNAPSDNKIKGAGSLGKRPTPMGLDSKQMKYMNIWHAVVSPMSIVDGIMDGTTSRAQVNAIAHILPDWHSEIVSTAASMIMETKEAGKFLPADKIATLGVLLNAPVDTTLMPEFINEIQNAHAANSKPQPKPDQGGEMSVAQVGDYKTPLQTSIG